MNDKDKLKKAEALLERVAEHMKVPLYENGEALAKEIENFLNPKIDWDKVPAGTVFKNGKHEFLKLEFDDRDFTYATIPPQPSHIHPIPWPEDGTQPDWIDGNTLVYLSSGHVREASVIDWGIANEWYAVLKVCDYRMDV